MLPVVLPMRVWLGSWSSVRSASCAWTFDGESQTATDHIVADRFFLAAR